MCGCFGLFLLSELTNFTATHDKLRFRHCEFQNPRTVKGEITITFNPAVMLNLFQHLTR
jgi:hypothetical protein